MASSVNKVILIGNLGRDPEVRSTQNGDKVANINIATTDTWKDRNGNKQEKTEWHRVVIFGKLADVAERYLRKGAQIFVEGKLQTRKWQDQNGNDRYTTEIVISGYNTTFTMLGGPREQAGGEGGGFTSGEYRGAKDGDDGSGGGGGSGGFAPDLDDEIPF